MSTDEVVTTRCQDTSTGPYLYVRARPCVDIPHRLGMVCPGVRPDSNSPLLSQCKTDWNQILPSHGFIYCYFKVKSNY